MAKYRLMPEGVKDDKGRHIPDEPGNRHWDEYLLWVASGGTPDPVLEDEPDDPEVELDKLGRSRGLAREFDWLLTHLVQTGVVQMADIPAVIKAAYQRRKAIRGA